MSSAKPASIEELQVVGRYESYRGLLLTPAYFLHLERPLAYWALPTDRRLPLAFMGRTLRDLLDCSFAELAATPGIGRKKMRSFIKLLGRVVDTGGAELRGERVATAERPGGGGAAVLDADAFDPKNVSELVWAQWRAEVMRHGFGRETLGRLAPSLKGMVRVIWAKPMEAYAEMTLDEIRRLRTHGEKRVHAILEVFHCVHSMVAGMGRQDHLVPRLVPRRIDAVESWVSRTLQTPGIPEVAEIHEQFVQPLLDQLRNDATEQIVHLAERRLGLQGRAISVRRLARSLGLTRARIYQLLNDIGDIMAVRWPGGLRQVRELGRHFAAAVAAMETPPDLAGFAAAVELFYPGEKYEADVPDETAREGIAFELGEVLPLEDAWEAEDESDAEDEAESKAIADLEDGDAERVDAADDAAESMAVLEAASDAAGEPNAEAA